MKDINNMRNVTSPEEKKRIGKKEGLLGDGYEAIICIKIAQWRAKAVIEALEREDAFMDVYIQVRDMLSLLKIENGLIIEPEAEVEIIDLYQNPERLREKFRSHTLDILLMMEIARSEYEYEHYQHFRKKLFPYLPPYDISAC